MILAIDFDDTIHDTRNVPKGYKMGQPIAGAKESLTKLYDAGVRIIIHTIWADSPQKVKAIEAWLKHFVIPYHEITNIKPKADLYIDDKAVRFTNWKEVMEAIQ